VAPYASAGVRERRSAAPRSVGSKKKSWSSIACSAGSGDRDARIRTRTDGSPPTKAAGEAWRGVGGAAWPDDGSPVGGGGKRET
jgi:hypothetical protein